MTVTFYRIVFQDSSGTSLVGQIYWSKDNQGRILADLCPEISKGYLDNPIWSSYVTFGGNKGAMALRKRLLAKAKRSKLTLIQEKETEHFPPKEFSSVTKADRN